ncbi:TetR family transcriptional regulator C-terminal domain-containing protein [Roseomonas sp. E05]|uniref:TetR family transcriptional regulator C-terminal domain-containing protein n=1 Tax=Roseomonas sp. E05 TaxID=3046310 RepID=UPI0024BA4283|nr:TetR family transcriptional regulator C-terminal domain-containing protein [Roseomonas sp. E05]MDJ0388018.1 TetR family transcriptional regulator C-terminal domain-containing protein [Roseomonas sp. E05]
MMQNEAEPPATGSRAWQRRQRVAHILASAERIFAEAGFGGASMSALAAAAGLPKANLHYYFGTKEALYTALLDSILDLWLSATDSIRPESDPAEALTAYVRAKMAWSRTRPYASKVFANEVLHGAPYLGSYLAGELRALVREKSRVLEGWIAEGRMEPVDPPHLFFAIWAMTQTYADFEAQIRAVLDRPELTAQDHARGSDMVLRLVLKGCGLRFGAAEGLGE